MPGLGSFVSAIVALPHNLKTYLQVPIPLFYRLPIILYDSFCKSGVLFVVVSTTRALVCIKVP